MPDAYSYYIEVDEDNIYYYQFSTDEADYTFYFNPEEYTRFIANYPFLLKNAFGCGFFQFPFDEKVIPQFNLRIKHTIEKIICDFLSSQSTKTVLLYHCYYADGKQSKRSKKFKRWYDDSDAKNLIIKHEISIDISNNEEDTSYTTHYIGYLCPNENINANIALQEFESFAAHLAKEPK